MFNPGETAIHTFVIPFVKSDLSQVIVSYKQSGDVILEKVVTSSQDFLDHLDDQGNIDETKTDIEIALSQEESLLFKENARYTVQLNVLTEGGSRHASCEIKDTNGVQHHKDVMGGD